MIIKEFLQVSRHSDGRIRDHPPIGGMMRVTVVRRRIGPTAAASLITLCNTHLARRAVSYCARSGRGDRLGR
jgi:hypothetical protein